LRSACITDTQRNSKAMRRFNGTEDWVLKNFNAATYAWCRAEARSVDESGEARYARTKQHRAFVEKAAANKLKRERLEAKREIARQKLAATVLERDPQALSKLKSDELANMMDKWRETDKLVPFKSRLNKPERLQAVLDAIEREREALIRELVETSVELADVEAGEQAAEHEDFESAPADEDMDD
jgi:hypothetical protein